jgi:hypothetical protein
MADRRYRWSHVESALKQITPVSGGFSSAHRGIIVLPDGSRVFVKAGVDDTTRRWATKEIAVYRFLNKYSYPYIPRLAAWNDEHTSFALEALLPDDGWDWSDSWNAERLERTLAAMDALAAITVAGEDFTLFNLRTLDEDDDGWHQLATSPQLQRALLTKLRDTGRDDMADTIDFAASAEHSSRFVFRRDVLVHNDVRADNCAWNPHTNGVKLIDWNWACLGDRRIDVAAMLVHTHSAGHDVLPRHAERLDPTALHWLAGYWFKSAATPIWPGGPQHLRKRQLHAGITAHTLADALSSQLP